MGEAERVWGICWLIIIFVLDFQSMFFKEPGWAPISSLGSQFKSAQSCIKTFLENPFNLQ